MPPKVHHVAGVSLGFVALICAILPFDGVDGLMAVLLVGFWACAMYVLSRWAYFKWVPARCPSCGENRAFELRGSWHGLGLGEPIEYECGACNHVTDTGWKAGDGGD